MLFTHFLNSMGHMIFDEWIAPSVVIPEGNQRIIDEFIAHNSEGAVVLLEGGADIDPAIYGEKNTFSSVSRYSKARDTHERRIIDAAMKSGVPVFGICRGHQLLAAHFGGKLYQDIAYELRELHNRTHMLQTFGIFDEFFQKQRVNSYHHQAVKELPTGAIEAARFCLADTPGVNEAIIYPSNIYPVPMFSVQWHPEFMQDVELVDWVIERIFNLTPIDRFDYTAVFSRSKGRHSKDDSSLWE